jgi:hypothetical protein
MGTIQGAGDGEHDDRAQDDEQAVASSPPVRLDAGRADWLRHPLLLLGPRG